MERGGWLDTVDLGDFGSVISRYLIPGARADFEDGARSGSDDGWNSRLNFLRGQCRCWSGSAVSLCGELEKMLI